MPCELLTEWLGSPDLTAPLPPKLAGHIEVCESCRGTVRAYRDALALANQASADPTVPPPPWAGVMDARVRGIRRRRAVRRWAPAVLLPAAALLAVVLTGTWPCAPASDGGRPDEPTASDPSRSGATLAVRTGQTVESGTEGAVVADPGTGRIALDPGTRLAFDAWSLGTTSLRLEQGRVQAQVEHRSPGETFEIRTAYAVVRVTGTRFEVIHHPGLDSIVTVQEGEVEVDRPSGGLLARLPAGGTLRVEAPSTRDDAPLSPPPDPVLAARVESPSPVRRESVAPIRAPSSATGPVAAPALPPVADEVLARTRVLVADGRIDEALALLAGRNGLPEDRERLLAALGEALWVAGRPDEARSVYAQALAGWRGLPPEGLFLDLAILVGQRMQRPAEAGAVWRRYLEAWPAGRYAGRALQDLATLEDAAGRPDAARDLRQRLLAVASRSPEAASAFARLGRDLLDGPDADAAARWFEFRLDDPDRLLAEAALVGLMRARLAQGRPRDVRSLASEYQRRYPAGARRDEVRRVLDALPTTP